MSGRPRSVIRKDDVESLRRQGFKWKRIAQFLRVSHRTLREFRHDNGMGVGKQAYSTLSDEDLEKEVEDIFNIQGHRLGERMTKGALLGRGHLVQMARVRAVLHKLYTSENVPRAHLSRREYWVPGANSLWHIDGHHKLIAWKFVIHGGIDGYSRLCTYIRCTNNNRADTVLTLFKGAIDQFALPSRLRCDLGGENIKAAEHMIEQRGCGRNSVLVGTSVHNQRIERLWVDLKGIVGSFKAIFTSLEEDGMLNPLDDVDIHALHYVFTPIINRALEEFQSTWNNHSVRTTGHTPLQYWSSNLLEMEAEDAVLQSAFYDDWNAYGTEDRPTEADEDVDDGGDDDDVGAVVVPESNHTLAEEEEELLKLAVDPLSGQDAKLMYSVTRAMMKLFISNN